MKRQTIYVFCAIAALAALVTAGLLFKGSQQGPAEQPSTASQSTAVNQSALVRMHSPVKGSQAASVTIVEFFDPACETCAAFYPMVHELLANHPDQIRLVLRYAPFHDGSDKVVALLEAARRQDKFWPALETLLANQGGWTEHHQADPQRALQQLSGIGLNMEQLAFDMTLPEISTLIAQDLSDAKTLQVSQTPEFFVNGKPLPSFGFQQLQDLVDQELAAPSTP